MSAKTFLTLSASMLLGAAIAAPNAALAQFLPPPPLAGPPPFIAGPPPGLGAGGPAPGLGAGGHPPVLGAGGPLRGGPPAGPAAGLAARDHAGALPRGLAGAGGLHGFDRGGQIAVRGIEGRAAAYRAGSHSGDRYGHGYREWGRAAEAAAYAYGTSYASGTDCYYGYTYRRSENRRVLVCDGD